jgi:hypothetical protein
LNPIAILLYFATAEEEEEEELLQRALKTTRLCFFLVPIRNLANSKLSASFLPADLAEFSYSIHPYERVGIIVEL